MYISRVLYLPLKYQLFRMCEERSAEKTHTLCVSVMEIYNNNIRDLLGDATLNLEVVEGPDGAEVPLLSQVSAGAIVTEENIRLCVEYQAVCGISSCMWQHLMSPAAGLASRRGARHGSGRHADAPQGSLAGGRKLTPQRPTDVNADSSRSHLVVTLTVRAQPRLAGPVTQSRLHLVDLAGSESHKVLFFFLKQSLHCF